MGEPQNDAAALVQGARLTVLAQVLAAPPFHGNKAALARKLGYRDGSYIGQLLRGERALGEGAFRSIQDLWFSAGFGPRLGGELRPAEAPPTLVSEVARIRQLLEKWGREGLPAARVEG